MMPGDFPLGFRVLGPATERRRLIDWAAAFRGYAECDPRAECGREAYLSAFTFGADFGAHLTVTGSTAGFGGTCWSPWVWWDIDRTDAGAALDAARRLVVSLVTTYSAAADDVLMFYSGSKGFHLGLSVTLWDPEPGPLFHRTARTFAEHAAGRAGVVADLGVYDRVRLFRAPNSRHAKTGLHKRRLSTNELARLDIDAIRGLATKPTPFAIPAPTYTSPAAVADWAAAAETARQAAEAKAAAPRGATRLNRLTLDTIRGEPLPVGDRHRLLFSAAANLAEFGCPPALVHELLTPAGLDSGLPPAEVRRQVDCGLKHAGGGQ